MSSGSRRGMPLVFTSRKRKTQFLSRNGATQGRGIKTQHFRKPNAHADHAFALNFLLQLARNARDGGLANIFYVMDPSTGSPMLDSSGDPVLTPIGIKAKDTANDEKKNLVQIMDVPGIRDVNTKIGVINPEILDNMKGKFEQILASGGGESLGDIAKILDNVYMEYYKEKGLKPPLPPRDVMELYLPAMKLYLASKKFQDAFFSTVKQLQTDILTTPDKNISVDDRTANAAALDEIGFQALEGLISLTDIMNKFCLGGSSLDPTDVARDVLEKPKDFMSSAEYDTFKAERQTAVQFWNQRTREFIHQTTANNASFADTLKSYSDLLAHMGVENPAALVHGATNFTELLDKVSTLLSSEDLVGFGQAKALSMVCDDLTRAAFEESYKTKVSHNISESVKRGFGDKLKPELLQSLAFRAANEIFGMKAKKIGEDTEIPTDSVIEPEKLRRREIVYDMVKSRLAFGEAGLEPKMDISKACAQAIDGIKRTPVQDEAGRKASADMLRAFLSCAGYSGPAKVIIEAQLKEWESKGGLYHSKKLMDSVSEFGRAVIGDSMQGPNSDAARAISKEFRNVVDKEYDRLAQDPMYKALRNRNPAEISSAANELLSAYKVPHDRLSKSPVKLERELHDLCSDKRIPPAVKDLLNVASRTIKEIRKDRAAERRV